MMQLMQIRLTYQHAKSIDGQTAFQLYTVDHKRATFDHSKRVFHTACSIIKYVASMDNSLIQKVLIPILQ